MMEPGEIERRFGTTEVVQTGGLPADAKMRTLSAQYRAFAQYLDVELPEFDDTIHIKAEVFRLLEESYDEARATFEETELPPPSPEPVPLEG
jgi:hypothetical protein